MNFGTPNLGKIQPKTSQAKYVSVNLFLIVNGNVF